MKALLILLPHAGREPTVFPLGIAAIATALEEVGYEVSILDIFASGLSRDDVLKYLAGSRWDLVGINALSTQYPWAKWITTEIKRIHPQTLVMMGGPLPTFNAELVLAKTATDVCVISEGEETVKDLVRNLHDLRNVPGISYRSDDGTPVTTPPRPYVSNLDSLPLTNYGVFDMDVYSRRNQVLPGIRTINMVTSRGCPYACNFCSRTFKGARFRSVARIIEEIGILRDTYNIGGIVFNDELFLTNRERSYKLCDGLKKLKVYWGCQGRANLVDLDLLRTMRSAGCVYVGYGVESGSQKILDNMNKKATVKQNEQAIENTLRAGMMPVVQMIYGYPGEDLSTIEETVGFFGRVHFYPPVAAGPCGVALITPLPGSSLYKKLLGDGAIGDEEEYLLELEHGYTYDCPMLINLTAFSDEELLHNKDHMCNLIKKNYQDYVRRHPHKAFYRHLQTVGSIWTVEGMPGIRRVVSAKCGRIMRGLLRRPSTVCMT